LSVRTTKLLDKGYFFTSYSNTGTIVVGNMYNSEQLVYVYHKSPLVSAVVQFPRIITAHENNTLQVYDVTEPEEVVRYRIEDFVQRSRDKLEALVLDDTHLVLITQRQCFMFYLRDLTHEPHTTVDIELVSQFRGEWCAGDGPLRLFLTHIYRCRIIFVPLLSVSVARRLHGIQSLSRCVQHAGV
jgi:hypothetical protein